MVVGCVAVVHLLTSATAVAVLTLSPSDDIITVCVLKALQSANKPPKDSPGRSTVSSEPLVCTLVPYVTLNCVTSGENLVCSVALLTTPTSSGPPSLWDADGWPSRDEPIGCLLAGIPAGIWRIAECCGFQCPSPSRPGLKERTDYRATWCGSGVGEHFKLPAG